MGTFVSVQARAPTLSLVESAIAGAFESVARVDRLMHPTREGSDLHAIRQSLPGDATPVDPWTYDLLLLCGELHRASRHAFDPCLPSAASFGMLDLLAGDVGAPPRVVAQAAVELDLGGIAKGYAADRAVDRLRAAGCESGLVNCGGDIAVFGIAAQPIACVARDGRARWIELRNAGLGSSDTRNPARPSEHRGYYDGARRGAVRGARAVVRAPTAAIADALTKCVLALRNDAVPLLREFDAELITLEEHADD